MQFEEENQSLDIRKYLDLAWRYKWLVILPAVLGVCIATFLAFTMPKIYRAETLIMLESKQLLEPLVRGLAVSPDMEQRIIAMKEEVISWPRLMKVVEQLGLDKNVSSPGEYEALIRNLKRQINVEIFKENLIKISYENEVPLDAQNVVRTISDILIHSNIASQSAEADEAIVFIEKQLEDYREKLETSEEELRKFREAYTITLPVAARVDKQIVDLEIKLNQLLIENTEQHPAVIETKKQLAQLKAEKEQELEKIAMTGVEIGGDSFDKEIIKSVPRQQQELARLQRDTEVNEKLYEQLLSRLESARISKQLDKEEQGTRFKVIEPARLPVKPVKPNRPLIILMGLAVGVGLGVGIIFLIEVSNTAFRSVEEAKKVLPLPIYGTISKIEIDDEYVRELEAQRKKRQKIRKKKKAQQQESEETVPKATAPKGNPIMRFLRAIGRMLGL